MLKIEMNRLELKKGWLDVPVRGNCEFNGVPYVGHKEKNDMYKCYLCETGWMHKQTAIKHFQGSRHLKQYEILWGEQEKEKTLCEEAEFGEKVIENIDVVKNMDTRVERLGLRRWKLEMHHLMYQYVVEKAFGKEITRESIEDELNRYELMEKLSLLEMALLKTKICFISRYPTVKEAKEYLNLYSEWDHKELFRIARGTIGKEVIVPLVLTFLQGEERRRKVNNFNKK